MVFTHCINMIFRKRLVASLCVLGVSCGAAPSTGDEQGDGDEPEIEETVILTSALQADFYALATGEGTTQVRAELRVGGTNGTYVRLTGGDALKARVEDEEVVMGHNSLGNRHWYLARFATDSAGVEVKVEYLRSTEELSAPDSIAIMPAPFALALVGLEEGDEWQRGQDLEISWNPPGDGEVHWEVSGDCLWNASGATADDGSLVIPADAIEELSIATDESCIAQVTLERISEGTVDSHFAGGTFLAVQQRSLEFISTPPTE